MKDLIGIIIIFYYQIHNSILNLPFWWVDRFDWNVTLINTAWCQNSRIVMIIFYTDFVRENVRYLSSLCGKYYVVLVFWSIHTYKCRIKSHSISVPILWSISTLAIFPPSQKKVLEFAQWHLFYWHWRNWINGLCYKIWILRTDTSRFKCSHIFCSREKKLMFVCIYFAKTTYKNSNEKH